VAGQLAPPRATVALCRHEVPRSVRTTEVLELGRDTGRSSLVVGTRLGRTPRWGAHIRLCVVGARVGRHDCVERQRVVGDVVADGEVAEREGVVTGELVDPVIDLLAVLVEGAPRAVLLEEVGVLDLTSALTRVR
jgi:hypothetical protein